MIKTNELDLILNGDKKKKKDKDKEKPKKSKKGSTSKKKKAKELRGEVSYHIHHNTKNISFLKMYRMLKDLGVENNKFFLAIYDKSLMNVDPFDENLDLETKTRIGIECKRNYWYFIREVVRVPVPGSGIGPGKGKQYAINRGNLALSYAVMNNLNSYTELPRQSGKSISVDIYLLWLLNFGTNTSKMLMMNKDHDNAKDNIARIKDIRECLPTYLQCKLVYNDNKKALKGSDNKEFVENAVTGNRIDTKASPTNPQTADNAGRGLTIPIFWVDEFAFLKYNDIIFKAAAPALSQASAEARANNKPYGKILTSTPGDMETDYGAEAYRYLQDSAPFVERFYDWDIEEVKTYIAKNAVNGFIKINFNYRQLGRDEKWFEDQVVDLGADWAKIRREVLLEWSRTTDKSPYPLEDLNTIIDMAQTKNPIKTVYINKYYVMNLYEEIDVRIPLIMGVDVSSAIGKDASSIVLMCSKTKKIVGIFRNNRIDTDDLADVIESLANSIARNSVICIERNNVGSTVISKLLKKGLRHMLYKELNIDDLKQKLSNGIVIDREASLAEYGIWTDAVKRTNMHEVLNRFVLHFKERICANEFVEELKTLELTKSGRVDHAPGKHDDIIMAYLMAIWAYYYGNNITGYGVIKYPDPDPGEDEEAMLEKLYNDKVREMKENEILCKNLYDDALEYNAHTMQGNKSMADYSRQYEMEVARLLDKNGSEFNQNMMTNDTVNINPYDITGGDDDDIDMGSLFLGG